MTSMLMRICYIFYFQVRYTLYWHSFICFRLYFGKEILVNRLFAKGEWTYRLDFGPSRWSALNMGFVNKQPSRMQGRWIRIELNMGKEVSTWIHTWHQMDHMFFDHLDYFPKWPHGRRPNTNMGDHCFPNFTLVDLL